MSASATDDLQSAARRRRFYQESLPLAKMHDSGSQHRPPLPGIPLSQRRPCQESLLPSAGRSCQESLLPSAAAMLSIPSRIRYTATTYPINRMVMNVSTGLNTIMMPRTSPAMFTTSEKT